MSTVGTLVAVKRRRLSFRCRQCRTVALCQAEWRGGADTTVDCSNCGESYVLAGDRNRGASDAHYRDRVRSLATTHGIDLATANSVFEEIVSLEEALSWRKTPRTAPNLRVERRGGSGLGGVSGGIGIAVLCVLLSIRAGREPVASPTPVRAKGLAPAAAVPKPAPPPPVPHESPVVAFRDDQGHLTELAGADPRRVLEAYCEQEGALEAVSVEQAVPPHPGLRIGIVRRPLEAGARSAVSIRKDPRTGRWYVGNRREVIRLEPVEGGGAAPERHAVSEGVER